MNEILIIYPLFGYILLFVAIPIGGTISVILAAFLAQRGILDLRIVILVAIIGEIAGDIFWYFLGAFIGRYFLNGQNNFLARKLRMARVFFDKYHLWAIFFSKFIYGFGQPTLIFAGATSQKFKKVLKVDCIGAVVWAFIVAYLGYFLSSSVSSVRHFLLEMALILIIFALLIFLGKFIGRRYFSNFLKNNKESKQ